MFQKPFQILGCLFYCLTQRCKSYSGNEIPTSYDNELLKKYKIKCN